MDDSGKLHDIMQAEVIRVLTISEIKARLAPLAMEYGLERVYLFGSYARGEATEKSDVDLRIDQGALTGLAFASFYVDVEDALGRKADILTTRQIPPRMLAQIRKDEILLYDHATITAA